jgi:hypothetical protein
MVNDAENLANGGTPDLDIIHLGQGPFLYLLAKRLAEKGCKGIWPQLLY